MDNKFLNKLSTLLFYISLLSFIIGFNFAHNPTSGWYQQFLPFINNRPISAITFLDSLIGYAVTPYTANDSAYIVKTTNGGDHWSVIYKGSTNIIGGFNNIQFIDLNTGFACGNLFWKTTNAGTNWFNVSTSGIFPQNMMVLNNDTIWLVDREDLVGGVFRTTNGGTSWQQQYSGGFTNPDHIYFANRNFGFMSRNSGQLYRTTNSGVNWTQVSGGPFTDIYCADSLTGWKSGVPGGGFGFRKTTDGGLNWMDQALPQGGQIIVSQIIRFSNINKDTIWSVGGSVLLPNNSFRGILYRTTNQGENWYYQIPDTSIHIGSYDYCIFNNKITGWAYRTSPTGIHTTVGGDTTFTEIKNNTTAITENFILYQNYPNPFNPKTIINYELRKTDYVILKVTDINGREIKTLVSKKQNEGKYEVEFNGSELTSGIYFYSLFIDGEIIDTKKMILIR